MVLISEKLPALLHIISGKSDLNLKKPEVGNAFGDGLLSLCFSNFRQ